MHYSWLPRHKDKISPLPIEMMLPDEYRQTFFRAAGETLIAKDEEGIEQIYGLPLFIDSLALFYNKAYFEGAFGISPWPGETWGELEEQVRELNSQTDSPERFSVSGIALGRTDNISLGVDVLNMLLVQFGVDMLRDDEIRLTEKDGNNPATNERVVALAEALQKFSRFADIDSSLYSWNRLMTSDDVENKELSAFLRGKTAMIFGYRRTFDELKRLNEALKDDGEDTIVGRRGTIEQTVGITKAPQLTTPDNMIENKRGLFLADLYALTVSAQSKNPDIAWELLAYFANKQGAIKYTTETDLPVARRDITTEDLAGRAVINEVFDEQTPFAKTIPMLNKHDYQSIMSDAVLSLGRGDTSVNMQVRLAARRMQCIYDRIKDKTKQHDEDCTEIGR
jgi:ABC-type glycerol-3-phosphate transport system substrate-binding protein